MNPPPHVWQTDCETSYMIDLYVQISLSLLISENSRRGQERRGACRNKGHKPEKLSWVRFPVKMISVARKLSAIKQHRKDQSICFGGEITGTEGLSRKICPGFGSRR
jgi:hypothetical protein